MELEKKTTGELEDILVRIILNDFEEFGISISSIKNIHEELNITGEVSEVYQSELKKQAHRFANFMVQHKKIIEDLHNKIAKEYQESGNVKFGNVELIQWLPFYKSRIIREIRDLKLKKLI